MHTCIHPIHVHVEYVELRDGLIKQLGSSGITFQLKPYFAVNGLRIPPYALLTRVRDVTTASLTGVGDVLPLVERALVWLDIELLTLRGIKVG